MKIAFVIQQCGENIYAGAERLVLDLGLNLSNDFDIEILTTRSKDASSWANHFPEGIEKIGNLKIRRFSVDKERDSRYVALSNYLESHPNDIERGLEFIDANGPISSDFLKFIKMNEKNYDLFLFFGYSYWLTFSGISIVKNKSVLFPQAHDEPWFHFEIYKQVFDAPIGYIFQTNSEKELVHKKFGHLEKPFAITGHGFDFSIASKEYNQGALKIPKKFLLYIGRISAGKGCQNLSDYFNRYKEIRKTDLELVLIGTLEHQIKNTKAIILENLNDNEKFYVLQHSTLFIMPSAFESLNLACLEAWLFNKPVLVNGKSDVLKEHCINGQGGLMFENYEEFVECLDLILNDNNLARKLGKQGGLYVRKNYGWETTKKKYQTFFAKIVNEKII